MKHVSLGIVLLILSACGGAATAESGGSGGSKSTSGSGGSGASVTTSSVTTSSSSSSSTTSTTTADAGAEAGVCEAQTCPDHWYPSCELGDTMTPCCDHGATVAACSLPAGILSHGCPPQCGADPTVICAHSPQGIITCCVPFGPSGPCTQPVP